MAVGTCSAGIWPSAIEIQFKQCSKPRPLLVKLPDAILRLDPESPKGEQYGAHRDRWRRSRPHMATVRAPYCGRRDPSGAQDVLQPSLKLVAQVDHGLPGGVCPPGLPQLGHQLREPGLASLSPRHQVLACRSCLSGERWRSAASEAGRLKQRVRQPFDFTSVMAAARAPLQNADRRRWPGTIHRVMPSHSRGPSISCGAKRRQTACRCRAARLLDSHAEKPEIHWS